MCSSAPCATGPQPLCLANCLRYLAVRRPPMPALWRSVQPQYCVNTNPLLVGRQVHNPCFGAPPHAAQSGGAPGHPGYRRKPAINNA